MCYSYQDAEFFFKMLQAARRVADAANIALWRAKLDEAISDCPPRKREEMAKRFA